MPTRLVGNPGITHTSGFSSVPGSNGYSATGTHLSTNIALLVNGIAVAAVQKISIAEKRSVEQWSECGSDGIIDSAPKSSTEISGSISRIRFNRQRMFEALGQGFVHIASQRVPFDIEIQDNFQGSDDSNLIVTTIRNVWLTDLSYSYESDNFVISESANWVAESIESIRGDGSSPVVGPINNHGIPIPINPFSTEADTGRYRGALDAAGLINAFDGEGGRTL